jgi:hypothetical protein
MLTLKLWTPNNTYVTSSNTFTQPLYRKGEDASTFLYFLCYPLTRPRLKLTLPPIIGNELSDLYSVYYFPSGTSALRTYPNFVQSLQNSCSTCRVLTRHKYIQAYLPRYNFKLATVNVSEKECSLSMITGNFKFVRKEAVVNFSAAYPANFYLYLRMTWEMRLQFIIDRLCCN